MSDKNRNSADAFVRKLRAQEADTDDLARYFERSAFHAPPPLHEAVVGLVTSAGLHQLDQPSWTGEDQSFSVINRHERNLGLWHQSANWDRSGLVDDLNVVFPLDRLEEFADEGMIGAVAPRHLSFMGALSGNLATIRMDSGPAAANLLRDDGVNVVLLTPV